MTDPDRLRRAALARADSVRKGSPVTPPAWASKAGEEPNWRRAALILAGDLKRLLAPPDG